jgi:hypothetical protein
LVNSASAKKGLSLLVVLELVVRNHVLVFAIVVAFFLQGKRRSWECPVLHQALLLLMLSLELATGGIQRVALDILVGLKMLCIDWLHIERKLTKRT